LTNLRQGEPESISLDDNPNAAWLEKSIEQLPLLRLGPVRGLSASAVWAQCEYLSPTGSHKDRVYLRLIRALEAEGVIEPGMILVDYSSGNSGTALALAAQLLGYQAIIVRPEGMTRSKTAHITGLGARVVETPLQHGVEGAVQGARQLVEVLAPNAYLIDQGRSQHNSGAFEELGNTIGLRLTEADAEPRYFISAIGTGGTFSGISRALKSWFPSIRCVGVDIEGQTALSHTYGGHVLSSSGHALEGVSTGKIFDEIDTDLIDEFVVVKPEEAVEACRLMWRSTQLFAGMTAGANLAAVSKLPPGDVVTVFFDAAWKYFDDASLFSRPMRDRVAKLGQVLDWLALDPIGGASHLLPAGAR
jgi:cysteine synthase A